MSMSILQQIYRNYPFYLNRKIINLNPEVSELPKKEKKILLLIIEIRKNFLEMMKKKISFFFFNY